MGKRFYALIAAALLCMMGLAGCAAQQSVSSGSSAAASASPVSAAASASSASSAQADVLAAGEYRIAVSLQGGTGRATVASPATLVVADNGSMTATIEWSSSHYDQMVIDGTQYLPINDDGNSVFEIPVAALDEDLPVQAETTAMSEPHMIDYTLRFDAASIAAGGEGVDDAEQEEQQAAAVPAAATADFRNPDLGNGWEPTGSMNLDYAACFTVDYYEGGYALACLLNGGRYLFVPEGTSAPEGIAADIVVLQKPIDHIYLVASDTMCLFDALDELSTIAVSGIAQDNWAIPSAVAAMRDGSIVYGGKYSTPDYDTLLAQRCRLSIQSTMINHTPSVREKLIELGIPVLTEQSSYEPEPLGRTEWVKLYGAMFDKDELATQLFDEQAAKAQAAIGGDTGKTVAYFYINSNGAAVVRKPGDYVTKMIELAGGTYIFNDLGDGSATSSVTLEMERFYAQAKDADIIIYNATIDESVDSVADLVGKNELLGNFKAVKDGNVWVTGQNMYQQMMATGDIIADFNAVFTGADAELVYLRKMS